MKHQYVFSRNKLGERIKGCFSPEYNYLFNYSTGEFLRWGKTPQDNPDFSPLGPEILDIEISTICPRACSWCYKSNTANGKYMTLETFKTLFTKFPRNLTQIAFGIGSLEGNPDLFEIMKYCRENPNNKNVIPNITINGDNFTDEYAKKLSELCGAVAVSLYNEDTCYNAVKKLTDLGMKQVNIHALLSKETYVECLRTLCATKIDKRLEKLNAIVFLWLKPKGERNTFHQLEKMEDYEALVKFAFDNKIKIGFDSCSAGIFLRAIKNREDFKKLEEFCEPCESFGLFSGYINVDRVYFPCSFAEGENDWKEGINVLECGDFMNDVWYSEKLKKYRERSIKELDKNGCRKCLLFDLDIK